MLSYAVYHTKKRNVWNTFQFQLIQIVNDFLCIISGICNSELCETQEYIMLESAEQLLTAHQHRVNAE